MSSESLREMKKKRQKERQQNHLTTGVVDQLLVVKPHCVSNATSRLRRASATRIKVLRVIKVLSVIKVFRVITLLLM